MLKPLKNKKCKGCGESFTPWNSLAKVCSTPCALTFAENATKIKRDKEYREKKVKFLESDVAFQKCKAQSKFNEFIRLRDARLGCISCDKQAEWNGQWHASHWKSRGARPDLAFNEDNVHKACSICNNWLSGNVDSFRQALLVKIGPERVAALEVDCSIKNLKASDYMEIHKKYQAKIKEYKETNN